MNGIKPIKNELRKIIRGNIKNMTKIEKLQQSQNVFKKIQNVVSDDAVKVFFIWFSFFFSPFFTIYSKGDSGFPDWMWKSSGSR